MITRLMAGSRNQFVEKGDLRDVMTGIISY